MQAQQQEAREAMVAQARPHPLQVCRLLVVVVVQAEDMGLTEQHQVAVVLGQRLAQQILVVVVVVTT
jgi:hypothetical protein